MEVILKKDRLGEWAETLKSTAEVYFPAFTDDTWAFAKLVNGSDADLDYGNTVRPAKSFVFPQREVLYRFSQETGGAPQLTETLPADPRAVVFGVRPCDGRALVRNDTVFTCGFSDPYYKARRDKTVFAGLACEAPPSPNCFCLSVGGSPDAEEGLDILMTALDGRYYVKALTDKGKEMVLAASALFSEAQPADRSEVEAAHAAARGLPSVVGLPAPGLQLLETLPTSHRPCSE